MGSSSGQDEQRIPHLQQYLFVVRNFMSISILKAIYSDLLGQKTNYKEAYELVKLLPKPWTTKEWKKNRANLLNDHCENCNSTITPFVLQHTKQPPEFAKVYDWFANNLLINSTENFEQEVNKKINEAIKLELSTNFEMRESCPQCRTINIRIRKTMLPKYSCINKHLFDETVISKYYIKSQTTNLAFVTKKSGDILAQIILYKMRRDFSENNDFEIGRKALLISLQESIKYWEFKNIKTLCKKCAFLEDQKYIYRKGIPYYNR